MTKQTQFEFTYDKNGNIHSGRTVTKSLNFNYDYYSKWFKDPANTSKMIKQGNCYLYPGAQFPSYKEFKRSSTFKQSAEKVASDYVSARNSWELDRNTGMTQGHMLENKHGWNWTHAWGQRYVRRVANLLRAKGMK